MTRRAARCPGCGAELHPRFTRGPVPGEPVPVQHCRSCWGVLLSAEAVSALRLGPDLDGCDAAPGPGARSCPRCERTMQELVLPARLNPLRRIELDRCLLCRAVFFDADELKDSLGRPASIAASPDDEYLAADPEPVPDDPGDDWDDSPLFLAAVPGAVRVLWRLWVWLRAHE